MKVIKDINTLEYLSSKSTYKKQTYTPDLQKAKIFTDSKVYTMVKSASKNSERILDIQRVTLIEFNNPLIT